MENKLQVLVDNAAELKNLGFNRLSETLNDKVAEVNEVEALKKRLTLAFEFYRVVTQDIIDEFNATLKKKTMTKSNDGYPQYDSLRFTNIENYDKIPPKEALLALKEAKDRNLFDSFEICDIQTVIERPDPIIFGRIKGAPKHYFFIAQWLNDIKIEDLLKDNQG